MLWLFLAVALADPAPPRIDPAVHPISATILAVDLDPDAVPEMDASRWALDAVHPVEVEVLTKPIGMVPEGWPFTPILGSRVLLVFDAPVHQGALTDGARTWDVDIDPNQDWTPSIAVNQVGILSDTGGRHAYVSAWLGELAPLQLPADALAFRVVDARTGDTASTGELTLRLAYDQATEDAYGANYTLANVYDIDLTGLTTPGDYYIVWDGVGRSFTFSVGPDVWNHPFDVAFHGLYQQRCGTALDPAITDWSHGACHTAPVTLTTADYFVVGEDAFGALPAASTGVTVDASGGYHDAGDYDRNGGHLVAVDALVDLYELDPALHGSDALGLPESGNGVPDLLDEALWGMSTWKKLQGGDGGVAGGVGTTMYPDLDEMPDVDDGQWYAYAEDPLTSYRFAGAAAKVARALDTAGADGAADWQERAEAAWTWAEANPRGYDTRVQQVAAAAELFKTTGDATYETAFLDRGPFAGGNLGFSLADWDGDDWNEALYTYATTELAEPDARAAAVRVLDERAAAWVGWGEHTGFRLIKHPYAPITNGTGTTPVGAGLLLRAWAVTGDDTYREWAAYACDGTLGANASGLSWTTGLGQRRVEHPLDTPSLADGIEEPVPGLTLYGPNYATSGGNNTGVVLAAFDPPVDRWPLMQRYADASYVPNMNEFTVAESLAPTLFAFGALADWDVAIDGGDTDEAEDTGSHDEGSDEIPVDRRKCGCTTGSASGAWVAAILAVVVMRRRRS
jgi:MYXO-CTERM domain-containing protein